MHGFALSLLLDVPILLDKPILKFILRRETYTLFDLFGEIGGLVEFFYVVIFGFVTIFSSE